MHASRYPPRICWLFHAACKRRTLATCEQLGTLAGIAGTTAQHDVFSRDYFCVVDDVLPARKAPFARPRSEGAAAVDTMSVPLDNFLFEPIGDVPTVHYCSLIGFSPIREHRLKTRCSRLKRAPVLSVRLPCAASRRPQPCRGHVAERFCSPSVLHLRRHASGRRYAPEPLAIDTVGRFASMSRGIAMPGA